MTLADFEARALARGGRRPAVDGWSYARLAGTASLAAARLSGARRVLVWADRSAAGAAALHACALGGLCYVPVDPLWPAARLELVARDCGADAVLVASPRPLPAAWRGLRRVALEPGSAPRPRPKVRAHDAAYVRYTSGSTGRPKGVVITQANAAAFLGWARRALPLKASDVVAGVAPWTFDLSVFDLYATAAAGAHLRVVPRPDVLFPAAVSARLSRWRASVLYTTPSHLAALPPAGLKSLRLLLSAGEPLTPALARALQAAAPRARVWNLYGPTETNVCAAYPLPRPFMGESVPIGRPASGASLRLGPKRELLVRGPSVFAGCADAWYRTGDLARREKGLWHCLGRRDDQVKWRGYRIELGEVEAALERHALVRRAAAALVETADGPMLRARVLARGKADEASVLRSAAEVLPSYMLPVSVSFGPLPLTPRGKLDRSALKVILGVSP